MPLLIRKWTLLLEEIHQNENGQSDGEPLVKIAIGATIRNPYAGISSESLDAVVAESAQLGHQFGQRLLITLGGRPIQSYGKAAVVGTAGEYEHGNAFLTTTFADPVREALGGGKAWIPSTGKRGSLGDSVDIPLACKEALYVRSHYDTITFSVPDAPGPDEVVVAFAVASRGRLRARLGGLAYTEIEGGDGLR